MVRNEIQNPLVISSNSTFCQVGYPSGGTPMPVANQGGSLDTYTKHDLHDYHELGTLITDQGTLVQTAGKIVKVHYLDAQTDGTFGFHFNDIKPGGGTINCGWYFIQREGVVKSFVPYPAFHFKTTTIGSGLVVGTWPSIPCSGTLRLSLIYTDADVS